MSKKDKGKHQRLFTTTTRGHGLKTASRICSFTQRLFIIIISSSSSSLYYRYLIYIKAKLRKYLQEIPSWLFTTDKIVNECFFSDWCTSDLFSMNPDSCVIMNDFYDFEWRLWQVQVFFVSENGQSVSLLLYALMFYRRWGGFFLNVPNLFCVLLNICWLYECFC